MKQRPFSVTLLSILGIVFGCIYLLCCSCQMIEAVVGLTIPGSFPGEAKIVAMSEQPGLSLLILALVTIQLLLAVLLIVASIGSLALKPWARGGMLLWAWTNVLMNAAILLLQTWVGGSAALDEAMAAGEVPIPRESMFALVLFFVFVFYAITMIYPTCAAPIFFNTAAAKRAFAEQGNWPPNPPGPPMQGYGYGPPQQGGYYPYGQQQYGQPQYPPYDPNLPPQGYPPYPPPEDRPPQG